MALYKLARFEVRADAWAAAERAMFDYATFVRAELAGFMWTMYSDPAAPGRYTAMIRADNQAAEDRAARASGTQAFEAALAPLLLAPIETTEAQLVTSSDLAPRHRRR